MEIVVATSVEEFSGAEWNRLFPGELEDWTYYHAVERSRLPGFSWLYFGVRERGVLTANVLAFWFVALLEVLTRLHRDDLALTLLDAEPRS